VPIISGGGGASTLSGAVITGTAAAGQVPVATSAAAGSWKYPPGFEINYTQITSVVNVVSTTEASPTTVIAPGAVTFDGTAVLLHFFSPGVTAPNAAAGDILRISLYEGASELGVIAFLQTSAAQSMSAPISAFLKFTPTAASHTYIIGSSVNTTTGTPHVSAGAGGTATFSPAFVRFTKV